LIKVENISYTYPSGFEAVKNVSLDIRDGEFIAIMGENGAGKTTLIKHFNGLLKPTSGNVFVDGINTKSTSVAFLSKKVGLIFQNPDHQLFCESVSEEIAFALRNFGFDEKTIEKRVEWALNLLDLNDYKSSSPLMLSGGEKKRVALACVLAWEPKFLIIDEPTIGQDYAQKEKLRNFITQLNSQKKTVIIVTHDVEFVAECNPRVILMSAGRVVADGGAKEVLTNSQLVQRAALTLPQITEVFSRLSALGFPPDIIDVYEAKEYFLKRFKGSHVEY
jgi:energy-coupling factor transport system ATP-binding protein